MLQQPEHGFRHPWFRRTAPGGTNPGSDFRMLPGGKGVHQACAAGKLSAGRFPVHMLGRVGYGLFADHLKASLGGTGTDITHI